MSTEEQEKVDIVLLVLVCIQMALPYLIVAGLVYMVFNGGWNEQVAPLVEQGKVWFEQGKDVFFNGLPNK